MMLLITIHTKNVNKLNIAHVISCDSLETQEIPLGHLNRSFLYFDYSIFWTLEYFMKILQCLKTPSAPPGIADHHAKSFLAGGEKCTFFLRTPVMQKCGMALMGRMVCWDNKFLSWGSSMIETFWWYVFLAF